MIAYINELHEKGRVGTAIAYRTTINSLNLYKKGLYLQDITPALLGDYEKHLTDAGKSYTTVSIYIRQLRAIINQAINASVLSAENYPFRKYEIPSGRNVKKALSEKDIQKILNHTPEKADEQKALDFWILSYLCSGINFADIIELKPSNINGDYLHFIRAKTKTLKRKICGQLKLALIPGQKIVSGNGETLFLKPLPVPGIRSRACTENS